MRPLDTCERPDVGGEHLLEGLLTGQPVGALTRVVAEECRIAGVVQLHVLHPFGKQRLDLSSGDRRDLGSELLARFIELVGDALDPEAVDKETGCNQRDLDWVARERTQELDIALCHALDLPDPTRDHILLARQGHRPPVRAPGHLDGAHLDALDRVGKAGAEVPAAELTVGEDVDAGCLLALDCLGNLLVFDNP